MDDKLRTVAIETENSLYRRKAYCEAQKLIFPWYTGTVHKMKLCLQAKVIKPVLQMKNF